MTYAAKLTVDTETRPICNLQLLLCNLQSIAVPIAKCKLQNANCKMSNWPRLNGHARHLWPSVMAVLVLTSGGEAMADVPLLPELGAIRVSDDPPLSLGELPSDQSSDPKTANIGPSPYADWSSQGQHPVASPDDQRAEIHPQQADWINAAFAGLDYRSDAHCRAGWPECIRTRAIPSDTGRYCGYWVGGGAACFGEEHYLDEGTWGWDYMGFCFRKRVALDWWHGRYQGGVGQYQTDGPKLWHE